MKSAIYNNYPGIVKEIEAIDLSKSLQFQRGDFICPECGEEVNYVAGHIQRQHFRHYPDYLKLIDCDLRVDGESNLTVYQRLGIPLYLLRINKNEYQLNLGFKGNQQFQIEPQHKLGSIKISYDKKSKTINLDSQIINKPLTLIPIENYPVRDKGFNITFQLKTKYRNLINNWSDFASSIPLNGLLFSLDENLGKSVRKGDSVYSDQTYLWLTKDKIDTDSIGLTKMKVDGQLVLNNRIHYIYKGKILDKENDIKYFYNIADYFKQHLNVLLVNAPTKVSPLWPPVAKSVNGYEVYTPNKRIIASLNNQKIHSKIYRYTSIHSNVPLEKELNYTNTSNLIDIPLGRGETIINIDRKLTSTGTSYNKIKLSYNGISLPKRSDNMVSVISSAAQDIPYLPEEANIDQLYKKYAHTKNVTMPLKVQTEILDLNNKGRISKNLLKKMLIEKKIPLALLRYLERF